MAEKLEIAAVIDNWGMELAGIALRGTGKDPYSKDRDIDHISNSNNACHYLSALSVLLDALVLHDRIFVERSYSNFWRDNFSDTFNSVANIITDADVSLDQISRAVSPPRTGS